MHRGASHLAATATLPCARALLAAAALLLAADGRAAEPSKPSLWLAEPLALGEGVSAAQLDAVDRALLGSLGRSPLEVVHGRAALLARGEGVPQSGQYLEEARTALERGESLYGEFKFDLAAESFAHAAFRYGAVIYDLEPAALDRLYHARLMEGICLIEAGEPQRAREAFLKLVTLRPDYEPDPSLISPRARKLYREVQSSTRKAGLAALEIGSSPAGATVVLDGLARGETPLTVTELPPGKHYLSLALVGHAPHRAEVEVRAPSTSSGVVSLRPAAPRRALDEIDRAARAGLGFETVAGQLAQLSEASGVSSLVLVGVSPAPAPQGERDLLVTALRVEDGNRSAVALLTGGAALEQDLQAAAPLLLAETWPAAQLPEGTSLEQVDFSSALLGRAASGSAVAASPGGDDEGSALGSWWLWTGVAGAALIGAAVVTTVVLWPREAPPPPQDRVHFEVAF